MSEDPPIERDDPAISRRLPSRRSSNPNPSSGTPRSPSSSTERPDTTRLQSTLRTDRRNAAYHRGARPQSAAGGTTRRVRRPAGSNLNRPEIAENRRLRRNPSLRPNGRGQHRGRRQAGSTTSHRPTNRAGSSVRVPAAFRTERASCYPRGHSLSRLGVVSQADEGENASNGCDFLGFPSRPVSGTVL